MNSRLRPIPLVLAVALLGIAQPSARAAADAWPLYDMAAQRIREGDALGKSSPAASSLVFAGYPPFSPVWEETAKNAYEFNASALEAVHKATALKVARWPASQRGEGIQLKYLGELRNVANEVADAAMYEHVHGKNVAALGRIRDLLHIADLLDEPADELAVQSLVALGIRATACQRLQVIATELPLTRDAKQKDDGGGGGDQPVPLETVRALIAQLFTLDDPTLRANELIDHEKQHVSDHPFTPEATERLIEQLRRGQMERNLTATSLAAQVFRFDHGRWPASIDEFANELPAPPADAWGPMGYALLKNGRPDGSHRPVVYSRHGVGEGATLDYPTGGPQFGYYNSRMLGTKDAPVAGQFRDVSLWAPGNLPPGFKRLR